MAKDSGYIDLGSKYNTEMKAAEAPKERVDYPTVYIRHKSDGVGSKMDEMPDEGEATIKYRIRTYKENLQDDTCECEMEILSIKPSSVKEKKRKSSEDSLDEALTSIAKSKKK